MHNPFCYRKCNEYHGRGFAITSQYVVLLAICILAVIPHHQVLAQSKSTEVAKSPLCTRDSALDMITQQVGLTKTFTDPKQRLTVLIRAADLFWPYQQDTARAQRRYAGAEKEPQARAYPVEHHGD